MTAPFSSATSETIREGLLLRSAVTMPIEVYGEQRIRKFDAAETDLARVLKRRRGAKRSAR